MTSSKASFHERNLLARAWAAGAPDRSVAALLERALPSPADPPPGGVLFWGKSADATARAWRSRGKTSRGLVIAPEAASREPGWPSRWIRVAGEHPLPGRGSREAGDALVEFLAQDFGDGGLTIFLSGGASSLAWLPPAALSSEGLMRRLRGLYALPLPIPVLNRARSALCRLKGGGAGRWYRAQNPRSPARVHLLSDVAPFGPEVVGSGPFRDSGIPHRVWADNATLVALVRARAPGLPGTPPTAPRIRAVADWARAARGFLARELAVGGGRAIWWGGEPLIHLPPGAGSGEPCGGRLTHLAALIARDSWAALRDGRAEILLAASDGVDGRSGGAGVSLGPASRTARVAMARPGARRQLERALREWRTGELWAEWGARLPTSPGGANLQDLVAVRALL